MLGEASAGRAVRMPHGFRAVPRCTLQAGQVVNNDPDLSPEKSWTGELTAERKVALGTLRLTGFHETTHAALYSQVNVTAGGTASTVQNVDLIRTTGVESAYQLHDLLFTGFDLQASVIYAHSRIARNTAFPASEGKWQPRVPEWRGDVVASYSFLGKWDATVAARYSGRQYGQLDNSDVNDRAYTGVSRFFTIDARIRYRATRQLTASLGIDNLNGENYWNFHLYPMRSYSLEMNYDF